MPTLLLRLAAPLQTWGADSKFDIRNTNREPTKSGVTGLLAAALGRRRDADLSDLTALRFGVRVDQEGELLRDFHMAHGVKPYLTQRYYLADAVFLVGLESDDRAILERLEQALRNPAFPLFLGRRSCPPTLPLVLGVRDAALLQALQTEPWQAATWRMERLNHRLRIVTDALPGEEQGVPVRDAAVSFSPEHRKYTIRRAVLRPSVQIGQESEHDPMAELREAGV